MTNHLSRPLRHTMVAALAASSLSGAPALLASGLPSAPSAARDEQSPPSPPAPADRQGGRREGVEVVDTETRTLALGPAGALELSTLEGNITVAAGSGKDVRIDIVRRARAASDRDAKVGLSEVQVGTDRRGDRLVVSVVAPRRTSVPVRVNVSYTVTAPAGTRLSARAVRGNVDIKGIKGEVAAEATSGNITIADAAEVSVVRTISGNVTLANVEGAGRLALNVVSGNVALDRVKMRELEIDVTTGDVRITDGTSDNVEIRSLAGSIDYAGPLVRGGRYKLQTHSGEVRMIVSSKTGFDLQASSFAGRIKIDPDWLPKGGTAPMPRLIRVTIGDGGASVVATTFSGNVTVGRK